MRNHLPSLDGYDMAGVRSDEAAGWDEDARDAYDRQRDAESWSAAEELLR
ncbi:hypothetical protein ACIF6L_26405 [Kitasatospora sp. NPDC086009]